MRRLLAVILAAVLAAAVLAGCSDKQAAEAQGSAAETAAEVKAAEAGTSAQAETAAAEESDKVSILEKDADGNYIRPADYGVVNKLGEYKGLEVALGDATVTDEEVQTEIDTVLTSNAQTASVDRAAKLGDVCSIDYVGKKDGVAFEGGTGSTDLELGSHTFIDGFEDGLVGVKKGDVVTLNLTFPEDYQAEELAGQATTFEVTVNDVKEKTSPKLTDEWVKTYTEGKTETVEEFKKGVRQDLEKYRQMDVESTAKNELVSQILASSDIKVSDAAIEYEYQSMMKTYSDYAAAMGMTTDDYFNAYGVDPSAMKIQLSYYAEESAKQRLMEDEIFRREKMELTDADRETLASLYDYDVATMKQIYGEEDFDTYAKSYKIIQFIFDNAKIKPAGKAE